MAISAGSYTVGAAGDYLTWKAAFDDLAGTLTGYLTFTQISDVTLSAQALIPDTFDLAGYTFKITSNTPPYGDPTAGWKTYSTYAEDKVLLMGFVLGAGTVIIEHLYVIAQIDRTSSKYLVAIRCEQNGRVLEFHDCLFDQAGYIGKGIIVSRTDFSTFPKLSMWNCEIFGCINNFACKIADFTYPSGSRMENCIAKTTAQAAFQVTGAGGAEYGIHVKNCVGFSSANTWFLSNAPAVDGDNNGTNLASLPFGSGNKLNLVEADEFVSVDPAESDFWKVKAGNLDNDGVVPSIAGNTKGIRDNDRPGTDGLYSIGSDELEEIIVYGPVYTVGPGQEFSTIQSALDQLWTDQGAAYFSATQELRLYDDTYTEAVLFNASLHPTSLYRLEIKAATGNSAVVVTNNGQAEHSLDVNRVRCVFVEGIKIVSTVATKAGIFELGERSLVRSCVFDMNNSPTTRGIYQYWSHSLLVEDSSLVNIGEGASGVRAGAACVRRCSFSGSSTGIGCYLDFPIAWSVEACAFDGVAGVSVRLTSTILNATNIPIRILNCVFANLSGKNMISHWGTGHATFQVRDCIFHTCNYAFYFGGASADLDSDYNCFYNCTHIGRAENTDYDTLAAWQAFIDIEGASPDAHSKETDPLMTNPGAGDFSLQPDSPCIHAGVGVGVTKDINGDPFDPFHPDIGVVSTGIGPNVAYSD